ncbi:MAG: hypothetical protein QNJ68_09900 [Microcoleaceae cyanobacterium MO_207.B10]|nr:hypothetical protein [Microcoleaceae cyanobacterium MO_207.B10]
MINNYSGIDLDEVGNVIEYNLPAKKSKIVQILSEISNET